MLEEGNGVAAVSDEAARFREFCSCAFLPIDVKTVELLLCAVIGWIGGRVVAEGAGLSGVSCDGAAMLCERRAGVEAIEGAGNTRCCPGDVAVPAGCGCAAAEGR